MENKYLRFKKVFDSAGYTQTEYKDLCGVNQDTISNILKGKKKDIPDLELSSYGDTYEEAWEMLEFIFEEWSDYQ